MYSLFDEKRQNSLVRFISKGIKTMNIKKKEQKKKEIQQE